MSDNPFAALTKTHPAIVRVEIAVVEHGGTGRYDLCINTPPGHDGPTPVVHSLSRGQADRAAYLINEIIGFWVCHE